MAKLSEISNSRLATVGASRTNEIDLTLFETPTSWVLDYATGRAYVDGNGNYRLQFNIRGTHPSGPLFSLKISGITFSSLGNQAISFAGNVNTSHFARVLAGQQNVLWNVSPNTTEAMLSGDVVLDSKPTWFDDNLELESGLPVATASLSGIATLPPVVSSSEDGLQPAVSDGSFFAAAGEIGEFIESRVDGNSGPDVQGSYVTITSITVTPGVWQISGIAQAYLSAGDTATGMVGAISETDNSIAPLAEGQTINYSFGVSPSQDQLVAVTIPPFVRRYATSKTLYLIGLAYGTGALLSSGSIIAVRIR